MSEVGVNTSRWMTDPAVLERLLALLPQWEPPEPRHRRRHKGPRFGANCRRARPGDSPVDVRLPH